MDQTQQELVSDLKKMHTNDDQKKKSKEYYRNYYKQNKDKYKKRYQENRAVVLDKMKANRQQKRKKGRGVFTIRHLKNEDSSFSPNIEDNPGQQPATSPSPI